MKKMHRTYEVVAVRERALGGWSSVYYHAVRRSDGYMLFDSFTTGGSVREQIAYMCAVIDVLIDRFHGRVDRLDDAIDAWATMQQAPGGVA